MDKTGVSFNWAFGRNLDPIEFFCHLAENLGYPDSHFSEFLGMGAREIELTARSVDDFRDKYLLSEVLSKWSLTLPGFEHINRQEAAVKRFFESEELCLETNTRLLTTKPDETISRVERIAQRVICSILGWFDPVEFETQCAFGPGATTRLGRRKSHLPEKFSGKPHVTPGASEIAYLVVKESPVWVNALSSEEAWFQLIPGARFTTVPKNYN